MDQHPSPLPPSSARLAVTAGALHAGLGGSRRLLNQMLRRLWWQPAFSARSETPAPGLWLEGDIPRVTGPLRLRLGRDIRIGRDVTLAGRSGAEAAPLLEIGDHAEIGPGCTITVGTQVRIGRYARLSGQCLLAGHPGHALDARARAAGLPPPLARCRPVIVEDHVWLCAQVIVLAGVTIGKGTVVGAGSVVTRDLPPHVLAAGNPAQVLQNLDAVNDR